MMTLMSSSRAFFAASIALAGALAVVGAPGLSGGTRNRVCGVPASPWLLAARGPEPALGGRGGGLGGNPGVAGSAEGGEVVGVEEGSASRSSLDLVDVAGGGSVAAFADGPGLEEFPDEWDSLLPVEAGSLVGAGPESRPPLESGASLEGHDPIERTRRSTPPATSDTTQRVSPFGIRRGPNFSAA